MTRLLDTACWEAALRSPSLKVAESSWVELGFGVGGSFAESLHYMYLKGSRDNTAYAYYEFSDDSDEIWISVNVYPDVWWSGLATEGSADIRVGWNNQASPDLGYVELDDINSLLTWSWSGSGESVAFAVSQDTWYHIVIHAKVASAGDEEIQVWVNGIKYFDWTGEASVAFSTIDRLYLYDYTEHRTGVGDVGANCRFDNLVVNAPGGAVPADDGDPGQVHFVGLPADRDGALTEFDRGGADSGADWDQVDEHPGDGTEYLESDTPGEQSTFGFTGTPASIDGGPYTLSGLHLVGRHKLSVAQDGAGLMTMLHLGGSIDYGGSFDPGTVWEALVHRWQQNPYTVDDWTRAGIDGLEGGIRCEG